MFTGWMECQHAIKDIVVSKVRVSLALLSLSVRDWHDVENCKNSASVPRLLVGIVDGPIL